jgi:hypothetical protein
MKYVVEMGSGAMIYIPSFVKISSGIQKLIVGREIHRYTDTQTSRQHGDRNSLFLFLQNKESTLKSRGTRGSSAVIGQESMFVKK